MYDPQHYPQRKSGLPFLPFRIPASSSARLNRRSPHPQAKSSLARPHPRGAPANTVRSPAVASYTWMWTNDPVIPVDRAHGNVSYAINLAVLTSISVRKVGVSVNHEERLGSSGNPTRLCINATCRLWGGRWRRRESNKLPKYLENREKIPVGHLCYP